MFVSPGASFTNKALQWRHNGHNGVSNPQPHDCLLNRLFRRRSKNCVTGLCAGNSSVTGELPAQNASNADFFSTLMTSSWSIARISMRICREPTSFFSTKSYHFSCWTRFGKQKHTEMAKVFVLHSQYCLSKTSLVWLHLHGKALCFVSRKAHQKW